MPRKSKLYATGTWFVVDLGKGQWVAEWLGKWALGVVTHASGRGTMVAYFFGPFDEQPTLEVASGLQSKDGVPMLVGDTAINSGEWPKLGTLVDWREDAWPSPAYASQASGGRFVRTSFRNDGTEAKTIVERGEGLRLPAYIVVGADLVPSDLREAFTRRSRREDD